MRNSAVLIVVVLIIAVMAAVGTYVFVNQAHTAEGQNLNVSHEEPGPSPGGGRIEPEFSSSPR